MITASDFSGGIKVIPSDTINIPGPESKYNGVSTAVATSKLTDSGGAFLQVVDSSGKITNQGVQVGDVVYNTSAARPGVAKVTAVDSATTLSLSANIFPATANRDGYRIYKGRANAIPFQLYCGGTAANPPLACDIYVTTIDGDSVFFEGVQPGEILPVAISKVNVGAAAAGSNGNTNTLTTAAGRYVAIN
jgi:hypothetical protein